MIFDSVFLYYIFTKRLRSSEKRLSFINLHKSNTMQFQYDSGPKRQLTVDTLESIVLLGRVFRSGLNNSYTRYSTRGVYRTHDKRKSPFFWDCIMHISIALMHLRKFIRNLSNVSLHPSHMMLNIQQRWQVCIVQCTLWLLDGTSFSSWCLHINYYFYLHIICWVTHWISIQWSEFWANQKCSKSTNHNYGK